MQSIRMMTFNIRGYREHDGVNFWPQRAALNIATIKTYQPDVIGFQECQPDNLETYKLELAEYQYVRGVHAGESADERYHTLENPIFWQPARFELLDAGGFYLSTTPETWSQNWGSTEARVATWVKLQERESGQQIIVFNTHFDHINLTAHNESARLILQRADALSHDRSLPVVIMGDFNSNAAPTAATGQPADISYQLLLAGGFIDSYLAAGQHDGARVYTYHDFKGEEFQPSEERIWRIDWLLIREGKTPVQTVSCQIIRDAEPPIYPSDHYPVLAEFAFSGA